MPERHGSLEKLFAFSTKIGSSKLVKVSQIKIRLLSDFYLCIINYVKLDLIIKHSWIATEENWVDFAFFGEAERHNVTGIGWRTY